MENLSFLDKKSGIFGKKFFKKRKKDKKRKESKQRKEEEEKEIKKETNISSLSAYITYTLNILNIYTTHYIMRVRAKIINILIRLMFKILPIVS